MRRRKINVGFLLSKESNDRGLRLGSRHYSQLVTHKYLRVRTRTRDHAIVQNAGTNERPSDEVPDVAHRLTVDAGIRNSHMKENRSIAVCTRLFVPMSIFLLEIDAKHLSQNYCRRDDANHTQRISTGIGDSNVLTFVAQHIERFLRRTEARRISDGAVMNPQNLRKRHGTLQNQKERNRHQNA